MHSDRPSRVIALALAAIVLLLFLWKARALFLTVFLAVIAGLALARAADWLEKHRIRRSVGAPLIMLLIIGALVGLIAAVAVPVRKQADELTKELPKAMRKVEGWLGKAQEAAPLPQAPQQQQQQQPQQQKLAQGAGRFVFPVVTSTFEAIAGLLISIFIAIYIAISPDTYRHGIIHLFPHTKRPRLVEVLDEVAETLRGWLMARLIAMIVIGIVTGAALMLLGVRGALALGVIAGLMELIPFYGPLLAAIPAIGVALLESPQKAIYVTILYVVIQQFEGSILSPLLLKRRLDVPPVLTIVAVSAFGIVFGVLGMLAAEPLVAATLLVVKKLYVRAVIGDDVE
ncbi:MAG: AI-2E family transporter [Thermoanaerobaculia bacterium]